MDPSELRRAVAAGRAVAVRCGLRVEEAVVLSASNRLAVQLRPCDVLARIVPRSRRNGATFEVEVARGRALATDWLRQLRAAVGP